MAKQMKGFAVMYPEAQRAIASLSGKAAHAKGTAHEWDRDAASAAGKKGGAERARNMAAAKAAATRLQE